MSKTPRLSDQLCFALYSTSRAVIQAYQPVLAQIGLTYPQYLVLMVLWESDNLTVKEIGERLELDSGTLTPLLKRLETRELVRRVRDDVDQRQVRIELTKQGSALRSQAAQVPASLLCRYNKSEQSTLAELKRLRNMLDKVRAQLREQCGEDAAGDTSDGD